jgi:hypothetical protein
VADVLVDATPAETAVTGQADGVRFGPLVLQQIDSDIKVPNEGQTIQISIPAASDDDTIDSDAGVVNIYGEAADIELGDLTVDITPNEIQVGADDHEIVIPAANDIEVEATAGVVAVRAAAHAVQFGVLYIDATAGVVAVIGEQADLLPDLNDAIGRWSFPMIVSDQVDHVEPDQDRYIVVRRLRAEHGRRRWQLRLGSASGDEIDKLLDFWGAMKGSLSFYWQPPDESTTYECVFVQDTLEVRRGSMALADVATVIIEQV